MTDEYIDSVLTSLEWPTPAGKQDQLDSKAAAVIRVQRETILSLRLKLEELEKGLGEMIALYSFASFHGVGMRHGGEWQNPSDVIERARKLLPSPPQIMEEGK